MSSSGRVLASSRKMSVAMSWQFVREVSSVMVKLRGESLSKKDLTYSQASCTAHWGLPK